MKISLQLNYPWKYQWSENDGFHWIGYAFNEEKCYQSAKDFSGLSREEIEALIKILNGCFSAIYNHNNQLLVYVDTAASFPIFYEINKDKITISDCPIIESTALSKTQLKAYTKIYCSEGNETLLENWKCIPAGKMLSLSNNGEILIENWFEHFSINKINFNDSFSNKYVKITKQWMKQIKALQSNDTTLLIPLSGGYDSRLIVCILKAAGCENILCYTYGHPESHERKIAEQVAKTLKVEWEFIPYDEKIFQAYFSENWKDYSSKNHHFQSVPHEQDFFALSALKAKGLLEKPFIAIPGFCGDISGGSFLEKAEIDVKQQIFKKYGYTSSLDFNVMMDSNDVYQEWLVQNRLSKFIVNSVRVYEHFGGIWALPMWHKDFLELFYKLSFDDRLHEKRYIELAFQHYFEPMNVAFKKPEYDTPKSNEFKAILKSILPQKMVRLFQKRNAISIEADPCNLHVLYEMIYQLEDEQKVDKNYNINELNAIQTLKLITKASN